MTSIKCLQEFRLFGFFYETSFNFVFLHRYCEGWGYRWGRLDRSSGTWEKTLTMEKTSTTCVSCNIYLNKNVVLVQFYCQSSAPLWISRSSISEQQRTWAKSMYSSSLCTDHIQWWQLALEKSNSSQNTSVEPKSVEACQSVFTPVFTAMWQVCTWIYLTLG